MTARSRARDNNELIELINQAFDKVRDLAAAIEYDEYRPGQGDCFDFSNASRNTSRQVVAFWPI